jgi:hypothetical protein
MFRFFTARLVRELIAWAKNEHRARLRWCAERGYFRELKRLNEDYSPIRVLAEIEEYRQICANISQKGWDSLTGRERVFIRRAFEMRNLLLSRENVSKFR